MRATSRATGWSWSRASTRCWATRAPLKEFVEVCKKYGAYVLVDEAHSMGVLGENGRGLCEAAGVLDDGDFIVGTFSKTLGAIGGFCVSDDPDFDILRVTVRAYMFTASLPPSIVASVRQALRVVQGAARAAHAAVGQRRHAL